MAIAVQFPDGSVRDVPCQLREIRSGEGVIPTFEQVPLSSDPRWKFERGGKGWVARYRNGAVTPLQPVAKSWWETIGFMKAAQDKIVEHDAGSRSAA